MPIAPGRSIRVDEQHPANRAVLAYLRTGELGAPVALSARPGDVRDPYYELGTHPDVVEHVWDVLGAALPQDSRCVLLRRVALLHPEAGIVLALGLGTTYAVRLTAADGVEARERGFETAHVYRTTGDVLDLAPWGADWYLESYDRRELEWLARSYEQAGSQLT